MKYLILFSLHLIVFNTYCQNNVKNINWSLSKYYLTDSNGIDTITYFDKYTLKGMWDLKKVSCLFQNGGSYKGHTHSGKVKFGTWLQSGNQFIMDRDTTEIVTLSADKFILRSRISILDEDGSSISAFMYSEFENNIESITSGNWNNPSTWSCECIPQSIHNVTIKAGHTVRLAANETGSCRNFVTEIGAVFDCKSSSFTAKAGN
jgi:hypothetical protein